MKPLVMQFSPASCYFIPFRYKCSAHPVLRHPLTLFSLYVIDRVSHPCTTAATDNSNSNSDCSFYILSSEVNSLEAKQRVGARD
jgi:hypothetical protein